MADLDATNARQRFEGGLVTDTTGADLSTGVTFLVALGTSLTDAPTTGWATPDINIQGPGTVLQDGTAIQPKSQRLLKKLIAPPLTPGGYYVWWSYSEAPENDAIVFPWRITVK